MQEKILIVDDDNDTIDFLRIVLVRQGYRPIVATNGVNALEVANKQNPDLIILDVMMPGMDGFEVARSLHRKAETAMIPILMFTARTQPEDRVAGYEAGVDLYLTKPVHPLDLQANIKALLMQRKARKTSFADRGYLVGIMGAKGGLGVSTIALNMAVLLARQKGAKTIAAELRPGQGIWNVELNLSSRLGLANLLRMNIPEITVTTVENELTPTPFGTRLLLAGGDSSADAGLAGSVNQYEVVIQDLLALAEVVVLDLGTPFLPAYDMLTDLCNEILLVTEPSLISVRRSVHLMGELKAKGYGASKLMNLVVTNHTRSNISMNVSQIEATLHHPVTVGIPPASELAERAIQMGIPLCVMQPDALVCDQINQLCSVVWTHMGKK